MCWVYRCLWFCCCLCSELRDWCYVINLSNSYRTSIDCTCGLTCYFLNLVAACARIISIIACNCDREGVNVICICCLAAKEKAYICVCIWITVGYFLFWRHCNSYIIARYRATCYLVCPSACRLNIRAAVIVLNRCDTCRILSVGICGADCKLLLIYGYRLSVWLWTHSSGHCSAVLIVCPENGCCGNNIFCCREVCAAPLKRERLVSISKIFVNTALHNVPLICAVRRILSPGIIYVTVIILESNLHSGIICIWCEVIVCVTVCYTALKFCRQCKSNVCERSFCYSTVTRNCRKLNRCAVIAKLIVSVLVCWSRCCERDWTDIYIRCICRSGCRCICVFIAYVKQYVIISYKRGNSSCCLVACLCLVAFFSVCRSELWWNYACWILLNRKDICNISYGYRFLCNLSSLYIRNCLSYCIFCIITDCTIACNSNITILYSCSVICSTVYISLLKCYCSACTCDSYSVISCWCTVNSCAWLINCEWVCEACGRVYCVAVKCSVAVVCLWNLVSCNGYDYRNLVYGNLCAADGVTAAYCRFNRCNNIFAAVCYNQLCWSVYIIAAGCSCCCTPLNWFNITSQCSSYVVICILTAALIVNNNLCIGCIRWIICAALCCAFKRCNNNWCYLSCRTWACCITADCYSIVSSCYIRKCNTGSCGIIVRIFIIDCDTGRLICVYNAGACISCQLSGLVCGLSAICSLRNSKCARRNCDRNFIYKTGSILRCKAIVSQIRIQSGIRSYLEFDRTIRRTCVDCLFRTIIIRTLECWVIVYIIQICSITAYFLISGSCDWKCTLYIAAAVIRLWEIVGACNSKLNRLLIYRKCRALIACTESYRHRITVTKGFICCICCTLIIANNLTWHIVGNKRVKRNIVSLFSCTVCNGYSYAARYCFIPACAIGVCICSLSTSIVNSECKGTYIIAVLLACRQCYAVNSRCSGYIEFAGKREVISSVRCCICVVQLITECEGNCVLTYW